MCINDWRAGRLIRHQATAHSIAGGPLTIPANQNRVGITFSIVDGVTFSEGVSISAGGVLVMSLNLATNLIHLTLLEHGDLPTFEFILTQLLGTTNIGVVEYFMPEDYLAAGLKEFISHHSLHRDAIGR